MIFIAKYAFFLFNLSVTSIWMIVISNAVARFNNDCGTLSGEKVASLHEMFCVACKQKNLEEFLC